MPLLVSAVVVTALAMFGLLEAAATEGARVHTVSIEGMKFTPAVLRVHVGDRVVFENKGILPHTATAREPKVFDSGLIKPGQSWAMETATAQTIRYACLYHPTMEGKIIVERR